MALFGNNYSRPYFGIGFTGWFRGLFGEVIVSHPGTVQGSFLTASVKSSAEYGLVGALGYTMSTSPTLTPGVYWIGILYVVGTGSVAPTYQKSGQATNTILNFNNGNSNTSLLNQRSAGSSGRSSLPTDLTALSNITFNNHLFLGAIS